MPDSWATNAAARFHGRLDARDKDKLPWAVSGYQRDDLTYSATGDTAHDDLLPSDQIYARKSGNENDVIILDAIGYSQVVNNTFWIEQLPNLRWSVYSIRADHQRQTFGAQASQGNVGPVRLDTRPEVVVGPVNLLQSKLKVVSGLEISVEPFPYTDTAGMEKVFDPSAITVTLSPPAAVSGVDQKQYQRLSFDPTAGAEALVLTPMSTSIDAELDLYQTDADTITTPTGNLPLWDIMTVTGDTTLRAYVPTPPSWIDRRPWFGKTDALTSVPWATPGTIGSTTPNTGTFTTLIATLLKLATSTVLTIASGAVTATQSFHRIDTEASAASDDLDTINGSAAGYRLVIRASNTARTVVVKHNTGNIQTFGAADVTLDETYKFIELIYDGDLSKWVQIGGSAGGGASPLTTKGDLYGYDSADNRIPVGTNGQVLTANSAAALGVDWETPASGINKDLFTQTASGTVASTASETTLVSTGQGSVTLAAAYLTNVGRSILIRAAGVISDTGVTPTITFRFKLGSTTLCASAALATPGTDANVAWSMEALFTVRTTGATGTVFAQGKVFYGLTEAPMVTTATVTIDTTASLAVGLTAQWSASAAGNTITSTDLTVQVIDPNFGSGGDGSAGWVSLGQPLVYGSADDPTYTATCAGVDLTSTLSVGMKLRVSQSTGGTKYFFITKIAFSTDTTLTLYGGTDYDLANETISSPYFSVVQAPFGFPRSPAKWTVELTYSGSSTQATPTANTVYNIGTQSLVGPIGEWYQEMFIAGYVERTSGTATSMRFVAGLSTANNSLSDNTMQIRFGATDGGIGTGTPPRRVEGSGFRRRSLTLTAKTTYYMNFMTPDASTTILANRGSDGVNVIRFICAFL